MVGLAVLSAAGVIALLKKLPRAGDPLDPLQLGEVLFISLFLLYSPAVTASLLHVTELKYFIILSGLTYMPACAAALLLLRTTHRSMPFSLGLKSARPYRCFGWMLAAVALFYLPFQAIAILWVQSLKTRGIMPDTQDSIRALETLSHEGNPLILYGSVLMTATIIPIVEEIVFRGLIYSWLRQNFIQRAAYKLTGGTEPSTRGPVITAMVLSSLIFALIHHPPHDTLPIFLIGLILATLYEKTGSLYYPIVFHGLFNATQIILGILVQPS